MLHNAQQKLSNDFNVYGLPDDPEAGTFRTCAYAAEILRELNDAPSASIGNKKVQTLLDTAFALNLAQEHTL